MVVIEKILVFRGRYSTDNGVQGKLKLPSIDAGGGRYTAEYGQLSFRVVQPINFIPWIRTIAKS